MKENVLVNYYTIDNVDYILVDEVDYKDNHYVYLANENDPKDLVIRILKNGILYPLKDENEYFEVLKLILK